MTLEEQRTSCIGKRAEVIAMMRSILDAAANEGRSLTQAEAVSYAALEKEADFIGQRCRMLEQQLYAQRFFAPASSYPRQPMTLDEVVKEALGAGRFHKGALARNVYEAWKGGTVVDVHHTVASARRCLSDTIELLRFLNATHGDDFIRPARDHLIMRMSGGRIIFATVEQAKRGYLRGIRPTRVDCGATLWCDELRMLVAMSPGCVVA